MYIVYTYIFIYIYVHLYIYIYICIYMYISQSWMDKLILLFLKITDMVIDYTFEPFQVPDKKKIQIQIFNISRCLNINNYIYIYIYIHIYTYIYIYIYI